MIPQRVKLKGFLCYKEEQSIDFEGSATLWMLSGLNGSGKSAIFDAVTYALFGYHRGGSQHAVELINKESDTLVVEFDFLLDSRLFRAKRTLRRDNKGGARGTQQLFRLEKAGSDDGKWIPIDGTGQRVEFTAWINDNIGLSYETFTSSVLLLQGKAERLLDSKPEGRREVLASIVDLERYEKLHQKADDRRRTLDGELKGLAARINALPAVLPLEVVEAKTGIESAESQQKTALGEVDRLQGMAHHARAWQDCRQRLELARKRFERARSVLGDASQIEQAVGRLRDLREVIPKLHEMVLLRSQSHQATELRQRLDQEREKQGKNLAVQQDLLKQAHEKRSTLHATIAGNEVRYRDLTHRLRSVTLQVTSLTDAERHEADLARLRQELTAMPADIAALVKEARERYDRLDALSRVVPVLVRFTGYRDEVSKAVTAEKESEKALQAVRQKGETLKKQAEELKEKVEEATKTLQEATDQATETRTLLTQAKASLDELQQLDGAKTCRHCGQPLTAGHLGEEKRRRTKAMQEAEARLKEVTRTVDAARALLEERKAAHQKADKACDEARGDYREIQGQLRQAKGNVERSQRDCLSAYEELPDPFRQRVSPSAPDDWRTTTYPQSTDLDALRVKVRELDPARRKMRELEEQQQTYASLKARESAIQESLTRILRNLPADRAALRREHAALEAEVTALSKSVDASRAQVKEVEREVERITRERDGVNAELLRIDTRMKEQQLTQQNAERGIETQFKQLPAIWQAQSRNVGLRELTDLKAEQKRLEQEGTDDRGRELEQARHNLLVLESEVKDLQKQEKEFPEEARLPIEAIEERLSRARRESSERNEELIRARERLALLENVLKQRQQLDEEYKTLEGELRSQRLLADLLGRERLQLYLVRQAERQVVEYANAVLDRLSGGQLYLKLTGEAAGEGSTAKALELEAYNRATGERPINVAFLSGSQKFRVAVSLALGIGQYASRQHRPIESVIIDEGFGCLDSQGRQVMIQELQNLRSQMRCILLVSHQEDFAESFSDGYQFKLENGATRVERFRK